MCTRANIAPTTVGTVDQRTLSSLAVYITEPNRTYSFPIFGILSLVDGFDQSQLITDHERVVQVPRLVTHSTPLIIMVYLHTACAILFRKIVSQV